MTLYNPPTGFVPYTGATQDVDLNMRTLTTLGNVQIGTSDSPIPYVPHVTGSAEDVPLFVLDAYTGVTPFRALSVMHDGGMVFMDGKVTLSNIGDATFASGLTALKADGMSIFASGLITMSPTGNLEVDSVIRVPNMPTSDPADGTFTLWYDTITRVVKMGT